MKQILITTTAVVLVVFGPTVSIHEAAEKGNLKAVKQHLADGTDVNVKDSATGVDWTSLHYSALHGHKEITKLLIEGADVNATEATGTHKGMTPLDQAIDPDNPNASARKADLLRKHGGKTAEELKVEGK